MRKIFLHMMVSLDGYIEGPDKELDWHLVDEEYEDYSVEMLRSIDGMLLGRKVYELFADYWPKALNNPDFAPNPAKPEKHLEASMLLNNLPKYVASKSLKLTTWNNSIILNGNIAEEIIKLKSQPGKDIALFGGANFISSIFNLNLIDE